jgi:hypothetical protein
MLNLSLHPSPIHEKRYNGAKMIDFNSDLTTQSVYNKIRCKKSKISEPHYALMIIKMIQKQTTKLE